MNREEKRNRIIVLLLGVTPFLIPVLLGLYCIVTKNTVFGPNYGSNFNPLREFKAVVEMYSILYWPTYILGAAMMFVFLKKVTKGETK